MKIMSFLYETMDDALSDKDNLEKKEYSFIRGIYFHQVPDYTVLDILYNTDNKYRFLNAETPKKIQE